MRKLSLIVIACFISTLCYSEESLLTRFIASVSGAKDFSFKYKVAGTEGVISIGESGIYMSEGDKSEIFERDGVRYIYNKRRNKLDIEPITAEDDSVTDIFLWITDNINYITRVEGELKGGLYRYRLEQREEYKRREGKSFVSEVVDIFFTKGGDIVKLSYMSRDNKRISVDISDFTIGGKKTSNYFSFNPEIRDDMDITDYRTK